MRVNHSLNGSWRFRTDRNDHGEKYAWYAEGLPDSREVNVPHIWQREQDLASYCGAAWYEKHFACDLTPSGGRTFICFGAVDFQAQVWVNGNYIGEHEGGFTPFEFDITEVMDKCGWNRLTVRVFDPQDNAEIPIGKQGSWYTRVSGIWQDVEWETRPELHIRRVHCLPQPDRELVEANVVIAGEVPKQLSLEYVITDHLPPFREHVIFKEQISENRIRHRIPMHGAVPWSPEHPHLYDMRVRIVDEAAERVMDEYRTYFGMRKISFANGRLLLNNKPLYLRGALDQGFYPDTIYTAPSDEWIQNEIVQAKQMGFNLLRKHIKIEMPRYLYWADRMGMLIWQEPPNFVKWTAQSRKRFASELYGMIERDYNRPSIIVWSLYNEEWGLEWDLANDREKQDYVRNMYDEVKKRDPSRLICDNSGWSHVKTDMNDYHRYFVVPEQIAEWRSDLDEFIAGNSGDNYVSGYQPQDEPVVVSEFGVWGLPDLQQLHMQTDRIPRWLTNQGDDTHREDFKQPATAYSHFGKFQLDRVFGDLNNLSLHSQKRMYRAVKSLIQEMRKRPAIHGYVATEFTDIEWETNGWLNFNRDLKHGFDSAAEFNGPLTLIVDRLERNLWCGDVQTWDVIVSNHDMRPIRGVLKWEIPGTSAAGDISIPETQQDFIRLPQAIAFTVPAVTASSLHRLKLTLTIDGEAAASVEEELTITPRRPAPSAAICLYGMDRGFRDALEAGGAKLVRHPGDAEIVITSTLDDTVLAFYRSGGRVLFLAEDGDRLADKGPFTFRELARGESWDRTSSLQYVDTFYFDDVPLQVEMGWEMEGIFPDYIVPFTNYNKMGGTNGRIVHMFGNEGIAETSEIVAGYFQGWIGQVGGSFLIRKNNRGCLALTTWKLTRNYGSHPIATQLIHSIMVSLLAGNEPAAT